MSLLLVATQAFADYPTPESCFVTLVLEELYGPDLIIPPSGVQVVPGGVIYASGTHYSYNSSNPGDIEFHLDTRSSKVIARLVPTFSFFRGPITIPLGTSYGQHVLIATQKDTRLQVQILGGPGHQNINVVRNVEQPQPQPSSTSTSSTSTTLATGSCPPDDEETFWEDHPDQPGVDPVTGAQRPSSAVLGRAMGTAPDGYPYGSPQIGYRAHHIVAGAAAVHGAARAVLAKFGIGVNDVVNGVWLKTAFHQCMHTRKMYDTVANRINDVIDGWKDIFPDYPNGVTAEASWEIRADLVAALGGIRTELQAAMASGGAWP